jgi:imidazolonepropionase-like amidohydrolase
METTAADKVRIDTDLLIPGKGEPIKSGSLVFDSKEGKILFAGATKNLPKDLANLSVSDHVPVLLPGLWDCHVHYFGMASGNLDLLATLPQSLAGVRSARDFAATLNAGYTSVREVGGYGVDMKQAVDEGWIPGPRIYSAGAPISQTAGHGDLHTVPLELVHDRINHGLPLAVADGVEGAILAVRKQIRRGAKLIKICATGGVLSRIDSPTAAQFNKSELEAMVEEATRTNLIVAAHAHGTEGIIAALKAGVKTIEHGSYLNDEAIALMKEKDAILVATRFIQVNGVRNAQNMTPESYRKLLAVEQENLQSYKKAVRRLFFPVASRCLFRHDSKADIPLLYLVDQGRCQNRPRNRPRPLERRLAFQPRDERTGTGPCRKSDP